RLNELDNRRLVGDLMVYVVLPRVGRDHQQRRTGTISATSLRSGRSIRAAEPRASQLIIGSTLRLIDQGIHLVVVPAIGVVVGNHDGCVLPVGIGLDGIDGVYDE